MTDASGNVLSVKDIVNICDRQKHQVASSLNWHGKQINYKKYLSLQEEKDLIQYVVAWCDSVGSSFVYLLDFIIKVSVLCAYAQIEPPEDIDEQHFLIYQTDIYNVIYNAVSSDQIDNIRNVIYSLI